MWEWVTADGGSSAAVGSFDSQVGTLGVQFVQALDAIMALKEGDKTAHDDSL